MKWLETHRTNGQSLKEYEYYGNTDFGQHIFDIETIIIKHTKLNNFKIFISSLNVLVSHTESIHSGTRP